MKITLDLPESDLESICDMTGIRKKSPAIRKVLEEALRLRRREEISLKFLTGEWSADLDDFEEVKAAERIASQTLDQLWHD